MNWIKISLLLCSFGFLKEFRPGEAFITEYLTSWKNLTSTQVIEDVYPLATYSNLINTIVMLLLTDFLRYKPIIILCGLSGIIIYLLLTFTNQLITMKLFEFGFGLYLSTDIAYYTYIYAKVEREHYQKVSSYTRSAFLFGRFISSSLSQTLITFNLLNYHQLNYLTIGGQIAATISALLLPNVEQSIYFHPKLDVPLTNRYDKIKKAYQMLWNDFIKAFTNRHVLKWSLWWAAANCGYVQVLIYSQALWQTAVKNDQQLYNGLVEALYSIIGAIAVFFVGMLKLNWSSVGEIILALFTWIESIILFVISSNYNLWFLYVLYIIFGVIYHAIATIASSEVAKKISRDSYGLIFGIVLIISLAMESILTFFIATGNVFELNIRQQFTIYAGYFGVFAMIFTIISIFKIIKKIKNGEEIKIWIDNDTN
ncbi:hypothetical protein HCN44_001154 [Aphidius gifuensis]|uniref:Odorant receptor n=1 Tax=Aphidius gifuensis TaxID=684658 RepID=A0A834XM76_APHGI|nr:thiamine transporter 1-like [Aphidius gifuensis]KAF7988581.1 hypothetical protein HCN44_001154 [Aphidius gifuensis]